MSSPRSRVFSDIILYATLDIMLAVIPDVRSDVHNPLRVGPSDQRLMLGMWETRITFKTSWNFFCPLK